MPGRYADGWLRLQGSFQVWPETNSGVLVFELTAPVGAPPVAVELRPQGLPAREVVVEAGRTVRVTVPVCSAGPWSMEVVAPSTGAVGGRHVSVRASEPAYQPDPGACT